MLACKNGGSMFFPCGPLNRRKKNSVLLTWSLLKFYQKISCCEIYYSADRNALRVDDCSSDFASLWLRLCRAVLSKLVGFESLLLPTKNGAPATGDLGFGGDNLRGRIGV